MNGAFDEKNILRKTCTGKRAGIEPSVRDAASRKICAYISSMASYRHARLLLFYAPIGSEVDVFPLLADALRKGRTVALPRCEKAPGEMTFRYIANENELAKGSYGVREPGENSPAVPKEELARTDVFALVPGLSFDKSGTRLGYGKGYYDRFLSGFGGFSLGVCFDALFTERLPRGFFDRRVNAIVSERGVRIVHA